MIRSPWVLAFPLAAAILLLTGRASPTQEPSEEVQKLHDRVSSFLEGVSRGTQQAAYEELLRGSQLVTQTEAVEALAQETAQIEQKYGQYREFERVDAKQIGKDLVLMRYLYKCDNFPVVWYFTFYRTPTRGELAGENAAWRAVTVRFDTRLERLAYP
jgi:hypothetical protein